MAKSYNINLENHLEDFIERQVKLGRFESKKEVIQAALLLLERSERHKTSLQKHLEDGLNSGIAKDFNPMEHLNQLGTHLRD